MSTCLDLVRVPMSLSSPSIGQLSMCRLVSNLVPVLPFIGISPPFAFLLSPGRLVFIFILNPLQVILSFAGFHVCAMVIQS